MLEIGKLYNVNYVDHDYPCNCDCHTDNNVMHCVPCCDDRSYRGPARHMSQPATCLDTLPEGYHFFSVGRRILILHESSVESEI